MLWDMTATKVTSSLFVVCYRRLSASTARCRVGNVTESTQSITFGTPLDVYDSATYINGVVTNLYDATDRLVLSFSVSTAECSKIVVMGVNGMSIVTVTPSDLNRYEYSSMSDNLASVALSKTNILLAYRVCGGVRCC